MKSSHASTDELRARLHSPLPLSPAAEGTTRSGEESFWFIFGGALGSRCCCRFSCCACFTRERWLCLKHYTRRWVYGHPVTLRQRQLGPRHLSAVVGPSPHSPYPYRTAQPFCHCKPRLGPSCWCGEKLCVPSAAPLSQMLSVSSVFTEIPSRHCYLTPEFQEHLFAFSKKRPLD